MRRLINNNKGGSKITITMAQKMNKRKREELLKLARKIWRGKK